MTQNKNRPFIFSNTFGLINMGLCIVSMFLFLTSVEIGEPIGRVSTAWLALMLFFFLVHVFVLRFGKHYFSHYLSRWERLGLNALFSLPSDDPTEQYPPRSSEAVFWLWNIVFLTPFVMLLFYLIYRIVLG